MIDYLKFDIELSEWDVIPDLVKSGVLRNIKQIGFEIHREKHSPSKVNRLLSLLTYHGFRKWHFHFNRSCPLYVRKLGRNTYKCIELYFLNKRFFQ